MKKKAKTSRKVYSKRSRTARRIKKKSKSSRQARTIKYRQTQNQKIQYYLGNALMALGFLLLVFIYYPIIKVYLFPPSLPKDTKVYPFSIEIERIHVFAPIIANVNPFDGRVYHDVLTRGVALSSTGVMPGQKGTVYIFAHSSDAPWRITHYNTIFFRIGELRPGDIITIRRMHAIYKYKVIGQKTVWPGEVSYITQTKKDELILQTCTPIGTAFQRLLIFARPLAL